MVPRLSNSATTIVARGSRSNPTAQSLETNISRVGTVIAMTDLPSGPACRGVITDA